MDLLTVVVFFANDLRLSKRRFTNIDIISSESAIERICTLQVRDVTCRPTMNPRAALSVSFFCFILTTTYLL